MPDPLPPRARLLRALRWIDGALAGALLLLAPLLILLGLNDVGAHPMFAVILGALSALVGATFLVPYLLLRRGSRWAWAAHSLPILTLIALAAFVWRGPGSLVT